MMRWMIVVTGLLLATAAFAAPPGFAGKGGREPIDITADRLEADDAARAVVFIGNALARQGALTLQSDRLTIRYLESGELERIIGEGQVRIVKEGRVATGQRVEFFNADQRVVLTGNPQVSDGRSTVRGEEITLFLKENRSVVKGGASDRVNAVFQTGPEAQP